MKITLYIIWLILWFISFSIVNAIFDSQKWAILDKFKEKQYDLIFESNVWDFSSEYNDVFGISKKIDIYKNIWNKIKNDRKNIENTKESIIEKITSLKESLFQLEEYIKKTSVVIDDINKNIIKTKLSISSNEKIIYILRNKIIKNKKILIKYLLYLYKKSNSIYNEEKIDNLKSILLNWENIWDIINDLYFKSLIENIWKKLIDNHKLYISELYFKKIKLKRDEQRLRIIRREQIIFITNLKEKKAFKERILKISKWQEYLYKKYILNKVKTEKDIKIKWLKQKIKLNSIRNNILKKYNCKFVDASKNTLEFRSLSKECSNINKIIYSESLLKTTDKYINFSWPVMPTKWISAYYFDKEYKRDFSSEHEAVDIIKKQWSSIRAPADWYVVYLKKPTTNDYAYIAIKHHNWFLTIYGHVSDILVNEFDFVKKWEVFAQTGWEFWTAWAWFLTTWPHLHFEVYQNKKNIDPFKILNISYLNFYDIPEVYKNKFYSDFKKTKWYEFKNKVKNSRIFNLKWESEIERQKYLISKYAIWTFNNWQMWVDESLEQYIDPSFVMCIGLAETTLWKYLKTPYNIWNIWNTDSWKITHFKNARSWIYWIWRTLNNKYLWKYNQLEQLSRYWNKNSNKPIYASSNKSWHNNIIKCLSSLKWRYIPDRYNFRLEK